MVQVDNPFAYLAFNEETGELLAHGPKAAKALEGADRCAPEASIYVVHAHFLGASIWHNGLNLTVTRDIASYLGHDNRLEPPLALQPISATWD